MLLKAGNLPILSPPFSDCECCRGIGKEHRVGRDFKASCYSWLPWHLWDNMCGCTASGTQLQSYVALTVS